MNYRFGLAFNTSGDLFIADECLIASENYGGWGVGLNAWSSDGISWLSFIGYSNVNSSVAITDTNWHQIAVTYDGSTAKFYVNGAPAGSLAYQFTPDSDGGYYDLGSRLGQRPLDGDKEALEWSRTVRVAVVVWGLLEAFGSLPVKEIVLIPRFDEVAETVQDWLALGARVPEVGVGEPSVPLPLGMAAVRL